MVAAAEGLGLPVSEAVRFRGITKRFPGTLALADVSFDIRRGTCHALCGENGAGKSTLAKLLAGIHQPESGSIYVNGQAVHFTSPRAALNAGIGIVHQELAFCENLSVAENLCLADLPRRRGFLKRDEMAARARQLLAPIDPTINVHSRVGALTIAQQQLLQIAAAIGGGAGIVIFDEPTSSLSQVEAERLFRLIDQLKRDGATCIYVSHRMPEIFRLCDAVTVLRDGKHIVTKTIAELDENELVRLMIGRSLSEYLPTHIDRPPGEELLRVEGLSCPGKFHDISFTLHAGEVLGLAGLVGAGRSELAQALMGLERNVSGVVYLQNKPVQIAQPRAAIAAGIGLVPEDRKRQGLVLGASALHNASLPTLSRLAKWSWIRKHNERERASHYFARLNLRATSIDAPVAALSGGNQQKVVLAKWLAAESRLLLLDEPTRGVDVGAKAEIVRLIDQLAANGHAILLISSELPEILSLSTRILVLRQGRVAGLVSRASASEETVLRMMAGVGQVIK